MKENWATSDYLGGKVKITQPNEGYRAGLDAVILAAAVNPRKGESALDVGCGVGTVMLCSAWRNPDVSYTGIDIQEDLIECAQHNIIENKGEETCQVICGSVDNSDLDLEFQSFDHVFTNPPYYKDEASRKSPYTTKAHAHVEGVTLEDWLSFSLKMLKPRGTFTMIYPTDRLDEALSCLTGKVGELLLFPLWPREDEPAKRMIIQGRKQIQTGLKFLPGLILHEENGDNTEEAIRILKDGEKLF